MTKILQTFGLQPAGLALKPAAEYVGVSPNTLKEMIDRGVMPPPRCYGRRRIWIRNELDAALLTLPIAGSDGSAVQ